MYIFAKNNTMDDEMYNEIVESMNPNVDEFGILSWDTIKTKE